MIMGGKVGMYNHQASFTPEIAKAIHQLVNDPEIAKIIDEHSSDFYLMDSAP